MLTERAVANREPLRWCRSTSSQLPSLDTSLGCWARRMRSLRLRLRHRRLTMAWGRRGLVVATLDLHHHHHCPLLRRRRLLGRTLRQQLVRAASLRPLASFTREFHTHVSMPGSSSKPRAPSKLQKMRQNIGPPPGPAPGSGGGNDPAPTSTGGGLKPLGA
jgi:hypothetical protein